MVSTLLYLVAYLKTTRSQKLVFSGDYKGLYELFGLGDASYANCPLTRRSIGGYVLYYFGCPILASCKKQTVVALSSMEAEFMTAFELVKAIVYITALLTGAKLPVRRPVPVLEDNEAAIQLAMKPSLNSGRARHMDVRWHWLQEQTREHRVRLGYVPTEWMVPDIFTKKLSRPTFERLRARLQGDEPIYTGEVRAALVKIHHAGQNRISHSASMMKHTSSAGDIYKTWDMSEGFLTSEQAVEAFAPPSRLPA